MTASPTESGCGRHARTAGLRTARGSTLTGDAPALQMLAVTTAVLALYERVAAGDQDAAADVERMAALLKAGNHG